MRIAIIGLGNIGRRHAQNFYDLGCEIRLYDPDPAKQACARDLDWALQADGCVIATPPASHIEIAWKALGAGCHLMIEKPVSHTLQDLGHLFAACERKGLTHMVAYPWRYDRSMQAAKAKVAELGPIQRWACHYSYDTGNATARQMGPLLDCSHAIDFLRWLMGEPRALGCRISGSTALLEAYFGDAPGEACLSLDRPLACWWSIFAQDGRAVSWVRARDVTYDLNETYLAEAQHFLACIEGETTPLTNGWDARETLRVVDAATRSAEKHGTWIARDTGPKDPEAFAR